MRGPRITAIRNLAIAGLKPIGIEVRAHLKPPVTLEYLRFLKASWDSGGLDFLHSGAQAGKK
jgi:hypothetical protein